MRSKFSKSARLAESCASCACKCDCAALVGGGEGERKGGVPVGGAYWRRVLSIGGLWIGVEDGMTFLRVN